MHRFVPLAVLLTIGSCLAWSGGRSVTVHAQEVAPDGLAGELGEDRTIRITESELARLIGPRALSRAFRVAARRAGPGVVTVLSYGQGSSPSSGKRDSNDPLDDIPMPQIPGMPKPDESDDDEARPGEDDRDENGNEESDDDESDDDGPIVPDENLGPAPPTQSPDDPDAVLTGLGSGVIVDPTGLIITNQHVVRGASKVVVQMSDETEYSAVKIEGDTDSDIAILRIESNEPLPAVEVGNSDLLDIGDWVLAIGSPFKLDATVSAGIISAKDRKLKRVKRGQMLQTDAAINPGNSGGPLIDLDGKVVAINTAIATRNGGNQGIGFAIPINQAIWLARELDQHGKVRRAAMGIRLAELNPKVAEKFDLEPGLGVLAYQVIADSAAEKAGIRNYDVILEFAGQRTRKMVDLQEVVERTPIGSTQTVKIFRDGKELEVQIVLAPLEDVTAEINSEP